MRTSTMREVGSSGEYSAFEDEPVYLLTRKRVSSYPSDWDLAETSVIREKDAVRATRRRWGVRFLGVLGLALATSGVVGVVKHPEGRREVLTWVTMGHPQQAERAVRQVESLIDRLKGL